MGATITPDGKLLVCQFGSNTTRPDSLLTFYDPQSAEQAALRAVEAVFELLNRVAHRNREVPEERALNLRCAVHLGEVDIISNDRGGPHVSLAFRLEEISRASLPAALNPIPPEQFPLQNYVLCSEEVSGILARRAKRWMDTWLHGRGGWQESGCPEHCC